MNVEHRPSVADILDVAQLALRQAPVSAGPPPQVVAATLSVLESHNTSLAVVLHDARTTARPYAERNRRMFHILRWSGLAAAVLLLVGGIGLHGWWDRPGSLAFAQVVENVKKATSVSFTIEQSSESYPPIVFKNYFQGRMMRCEISGKQSEVYAKEFDPNLPLAFVGISDLSKNAFVNINFKDKTVEIESIDEPDKFEAHMRNAPNPIDSLCTLSDKDAELIGEEMLKGRKTQVYRILPTKQGPVWINLHANEGKLWIDSENGLPVQFSYQQDLPGFDMKHKTISVWSDFKWNEPLDPQLFSMEVPEGFKVVEGMPKGAKLNK